MIKRILILSLILVVGLMGQNDKYKRKSVTFVDAIYLSGPTARDLSFNQVDYILKKVKEYVHMERFDYNALPKDSKLVDDFVNEANREDNLDENKMAEILEKTLVPTIMSVVDEYSQKRASELVSETARMSFISTKAKELGITAENLEQIFNSAYLYIPYVRSLKKDYTKNDDDEATHINYTVKGGIIWYKIQYENGKSNLKQIIKLETYSTGTGKIGSKTSYGGKRVDADQFAFMSAVKNFARNLENKTKEYPDFKLSANIMELTRSSVGFNLGNKEGIRIDDRYRVGEWVEKSNGKVTFQDVGFFRVKKIGNNKKQRGNLSQGYPVIKGDWAEGMMIIEHPRLNIDMNVYLASFPYASDADAEWAFYTENTFGIGLEVAYNLGGIMNSPHNYALIGANFGAGIAEYLGEETSATSFVVDFGYMKRLQMNRLDLYGLATAGMSGYSIANPDEDDVDESSFLNSAIIFGVGGGINYAVNLNLTVGLRYFMRFGSSEEWKSYTDESEENLTYDGYNLDHGGAVIGLQIIYALPSLAFDPADMIRGAAGI